MRELGNYKILISTPEKWDTLTRRWRDTPDFVETIKLFLIDEIHLVNEDQRGPILEAVVSRMKTICICSRGRPKIEIRFIGVSATIPNIEDLGQWLGGGRTVLFKYFNYFHQYSDFYFPSFNQYIKNTIFIDCQKILDRFH